MSRPFAGSNGPIDPSQVVLPSLFDAFAQPDVLLPLLLANLLSSHLRDLSAHAVASATAEAAAADIPSVLRVLQQEIDRHFEHLTPVRTAEVFGALDLDEESERLGAPIVDEAIAKIVNAFRWRLAIGQVDAAIVDAVTAMIARRRFPAYHYATFDVVRAHQHSEHKRRHAPLGLTSCLDEAAIFAALAMTLPASVVETVVVLGSPEHYTTFGWNASGGPWWFYAKHCLWSERGWRAFVAAQHEGDPQAAFDLRFNQFDRVVTADGTFDFATGHCSIADARLREIVAVLDRFFGVRTRQLDAALAKRIDRPPSPFGPVFGAVLGAGTPEEAREQVLGRSVPDAGGVIELVQLAHRSLAVADREPYLAAARRSPACVEAARGIASVAQALALVQGIEGRESIFADRERIAMPEETLRLRTGSDRDLALLMHVLVESTPPFVDRRHAIGTWFATDASYVVGPDFCVSLRDMAIVDRAAPANAGARPGFGGAG